MFAFFAGVVLAGADRAEGGPRHFRFTITSEAAPEAVWASWVDVAGWATWDTEIASARLDGPIGLEATGELVSGGRASRFRITRWEPGRAYAFTTPLPFGSLVVTRSLEATDEGTRFTHDVELRGLGGALLSPILGVRFRRALPAVMRKLEARAIGTP